MASSKADGKRRLKEMTEDEEEEEEDEDSSSCGIGFRNDIHEKNKKKLGKRGSSVAAATAASGCQAENCSADLTDAKRYHRRHKVCEFHAKEPNVRVAGLHQRFCQQCSRFHELSEFDESKRSCRRRLAGHNERRRKSSSEYHGSNNYSLAS